jgi:hypothetical protein
MNHKSTKQGLSFEDRSAIEILLTMVSELGVKQLIEIGQKELTRREQQELAQNENEL